MHTGESSGVLIAHGHASCLKTAGVEMEGLDSTEKAGVQKTAGVEFIAFEDVFRN